MYLLPWLAEEHGRHLACHRLHECHAGPLPWAESRDFRQLLTKWVIPANKVSVSSVTNESALEHPGYRCFICRNHPNITMD